MCPSKRKSLEVVGSEIGTLKTQPKRMKHPIKQRNKCVSLRWKSITQHFFKITSKGIMTNKQFWKL